MGKAEYPYLYETHLHTCQSSRCARNTGEEMAKACKAAGYTGMIVTEHNWYGNNCLDSDLPWEQWVEQFCKGYENAKAWGDENDFDVFFGYEANYAGTEFLIYGVDKQWLMVHPEIKDATMEEQLSLIHEAGGLVVHAHPFREEPYIPEVRLFPEYVDAVEAINATHSNPLSTSHNNPMWDELAIAYAKKHHLPMTAGSDVHGIQILGGGVACKKRLTSIQDYCRLIRSRENYLLTNGDEYYNKSGDKVETE